MKRVFSFGLLVLLAGCAAGGHKAAAEAPAARTGIVESVTPLELPAEGGNSGAFIGGTLGGIGGAAAGGRGRSAVVGSVLGSVAGASLGHALQNSGTVPGQEIWVRLDQKTDPLVITQAIVAGQAFHPGDRVRVVTNPHGRPQLEHDQPEPRPDAGR